MPHVDDTADLLQRVESGASVRTIAADSNVTERTVRNRLRRAGIPLPSERRAAGVDLETVLADYRAGMPVRTIAERHQIGETWVRRRIAAYGVARDVPLKRKSPAPRYAPARRPAVATAADGRRRQRLRRGEGAANRHPNHLPRAATPRAHLAATNRRPRRPARLHRRQRDPGAAAQRIIDDAEAIAERAREVRDVEGVDEVN